MTTAGLLSMPVVFRKQVWVLTQANLRSRYRNTWAGLLWVTLNPLILYGVQSLVFAKFLRLQVPHYALFLATGLLPWVFLSQSLEMGASVFVQSGRLLKSFAVHPLVYLTAQLTDNLVNFLIGFTLVLVPLLLQSGASANLWFGIPLAVIILFVGALGMAWILATTQVFLRDTRFLLTFGLATGFYLTPIFYPLEYIPEHLRWIALWNPFFRLIDPFRCLLYPEAASSLAHSLGIAAGIAAGFLGAAMILWRNRRNDLFLYL